MTRTQVGLAGLLAMAWLVGACSDDAASASDADAAIKGGGESGSGGKEDDGTNTATTAACPVVVNDADCDKTQRPFVFVHGTYGSGDNFAHVAALLGSNGFCQDRIVAIEYNSLGASPGTSGALDAAIDKVLAANPDFTQVDLAGHSQGTSHCGMYLNGDPAHAAKVAHYVNFSGVPNVGDVDTLSISSEHDLARTPHHATGNKVQTVTLKDEDHFAVAASTKSFIALYKYLTGKMPKYTEVQCGGDPVTVEGVAETFADNTPVMSTLEIRELGDTPREPGEAVMKVDMPDADGHFGPIKLKRGVAYEFTGYDKAGKITGYQYFTPFKRSNRLVRLLTPASAGDGSAVGGLIAMQSTDHVVRSDDHTALVVRWSGGAFRQDLGASLKIDGTEVLTDENAGEGALATQTLGGGVVGMFMYDADQNKKTDLGLPYSTSFIAFTDLFIDASKPKFVDLSFTAGSEDTSTVKLAAKIPNWPSKDLLVSVMFQ